MSRRLALSAGEIIRHVEEDEFDAVLDLLEAAFPHVPRSLFASITLDDPAYDPRFSLAVERDGVLLSYLQVFDRTMWIDGERVRIGGIGSVGTPPQHRRRGYASALLLKAVDVMKAAGMRASVLFAKIQPFYNKHGWRVLSQRFQEIPIPPSANDMDLNVIAKDEHLDLLPWEEGAGPSSRHLRSIKSIYAKTNPEQTGKVLRSTEYWKKYSRWCGDAGYLVRFKGSSRGYFRYRLIEGSRFLVTEYGLVSSRDADRLLKVMLAVAKESGAESVMGSFCASNSLREHLRNSTLPLQELPNRFLMWHDLGAKKPRFPSIERAARNYDFCFWITDAF